jgi:hypothetical protein
MNLLFDQMAGAGMTAPLAIARVDIDPITLLGSFGFLTSLNDANQGIALVAGVDEFNWTIEFQRGGIPNEKGTIVTVAQALIDPALSISLVQPTSAMVSLMGEGIANGSSALVTVVQQTDTVDVDIELFGAAVPFSVVVFGRNGGL